MKKLTALILCAMVMLSCAATVFAADLTAFTVTPEAAEVAPGDTINFTISVAEAEKCRTLGLVLQYDAAVFELVDGKCSSDDALVSTFAPDRGFIFLFATAVKLDGDICTFTLKVRDAAPAGTYEVGLKTSMKNKDDPIETEITPASVTVVREGSGTPAPKPTETPKETEAPKETQPPKQTEPPKETEAPKATEPPKATEATEVTEVTEATEVTMAPEATEPPTEAQPTETEPEIPEETPAPETQAPTEPSTSTEPVSEPVPEKEFRFPLWAIPVYAIGFLAIIVILILKRRLK